MSEKIPFTSPSVSDLEKAYLLEALESHHLAGDGPFTKRCHTWLREQLRTPHALLTHSCTGALEMAALLLDLKPGDEVIMPSFTFVSTANAVALRGATPVFVDIRPDTLNIDENKIAAAISERTKALFVVHYAGVAADMAAITALANSRQSPLPVVEDAAQGLLAQYKGRALGTIGDIGCVSFHETKNIVSGEGGAILTRNNAFGARAEILREKGTNRSQFFRGQVDKYTWVDLGSSYLPSDLLAALLLAQLERARSLTDLRLKIWQTYLDAFSDLERRGVRRPTVPADCEHNAHLFYLVTNSLDERSRLIAYLREAGIQAPFHYVPLHNSPAGIKYGRVSDSLRVTEHVADRLMRLPLYPELKQQDRIIERVRQFYQSQ